MFALYNKGASLENQTQPTHRRWKEQKKMIVEFMIEAKDHYASDLEYKIVESHTDYDNPMMGYDIYQVETDDFRKIHYINGITMIEYEADKVIRCKDGVRCVTEWTPIH